MSSPGEGHNFVSLVDDLNDKDEKLGESESDLDPEVRVSRAENKAKRANDMLTKAAQMGQQLLHQVQLRRTVLKYLLKYTTVVISACASMLYRPSPCSSRSRSFWWKPESRSAMRRRCNSRPRWQWRQPCGNFTSTAFASSLKSISIRNDEMDHLKDALKRAEAKLEVSQAKEKEFEFTKARLKER